MYILALETATIPSSFALVHGDRVIQSIRQMPGERAAETFLAQIRDTLRSADLSPRDLNVVGLTTGPGSFTGLRCGVTIAKILAYTVGCRIVALDTMQVIAAGLKPQSNTACVVMDAQRNGFYWQLLTLRGDQPPAPLTPIQVSAGASLLDQMPPAIRIVGPGLPKLSQSVTLPSGLEPDMLAEARADVVATLTRKAAIAGEFSDPWTLVPRYFGRSAAEEKTLEMS